MTKELEELLAHTNSVLNTLDKDYEAMQLQKSGVRENQSKVLGELVNNLRKIFTEYKPTIMDIASKLDRYCLDRHSNNILVHQNDGFVYYYSVGIDWFSNEGLTDCRIELVCRQMGLDRYSIETILEESKCWNSTWLYVYTDRTEEYGKNFCLESLADYTSVFLNHCPDYEQLKLAFEQAVTRYIQDCMKKIQERNETLANKIKEVTK